MTLDNIIEEINNAESIVILTHENPDGDAIGSSLALYNGLKQIGKDADLIIPEFPQTLASILLRDKLSKFRFDIIKQLDGNLS